MNDYTRYLSAAALDFQESAIRKTGALAATVPDLISFAAGVPAPETFPWGELQAISNELLGSRDGDVLQYGATRGYRPLIEQLLAHLAASEITTAPDDYIITTGSQQGLDLAGRVLLDPGDVVFVELPTYSGAVAAFHNQQARLVGIEQDHEGLSLESLEAAVTRVAAGGGRPRFVYVTPNFQNPSGSLMSRQRRLALLEAAARLDLLILEDDPYGSIYFDDSTRADETRPIKADDAAGRVIYLGTISKTLVPGLRVGWMVSPRAITERIELAKQAIDLHSGIFDQRLVHAALARGVVDRLAPQLRAHYMAKRTVMETALHAALGGRVRWAPPRGGFFVWIEFDKAVDDRDLFVEAVKQRVSFVVGSAFFVNGEGHQFARLSFSAPAHERMREGVRRLAAALDIAQSAVPGGARVNASRRP
ncbi:MAG: PLP-dependent aminotransferase family protein [Acidobacteria bacterium]|nr:PLP-dependent aminotransferase family protein [Acidobacteriota bacterium]